MKIIYNRLIPWKGYIGINLCGIIFARSEYKNRLPSVFYNHEYIHTLQMKRDGYVRFYYRYLREFVRNYKRTRDWHKAYRLISYETEAYSNQWKDTNEIILWDSSEEWQVSESPPPQRRKTSPLSA